MLSGPPPVVRCPIVEQRRIARIRPSIVNSRLEGFNVTLTRVDRTPVGSPNVPRCRRTDIVHEAWIRDASLCKRPLGFEKREQIRTASHCGEAKLRHVVLPVADGADAIASWRILEDQVAAAGTWVLHDALDQITLRLTRAPGGAALAALCKRRDAGVRRVQAVVRWLGFAHVSLSSSE